MKIHISLAIVYWSWKQYTQPQILKIRPTPSPSHPLPVSKTTERKKLWQRQKPQIVLIKTSLLFQESGTLKAREEKEYWPDRNGKRCMFILKYGDHQHNSFSYPYSGYQHTTFTIRESLDRSVIELHCSTHSDVETCPNYGKSYFFHFKPSGLYFNNPNAIVDLSASEIIVKVPW